jgi:uncharacterized spore protein YtfJ
MSIQEILGQARDAVTVKRVYGDPYDKGGITVIPAASVAGGGGGGVGPSPNGKPTGQGGGFGVSARPVGAFVVKDGELTWKPAVNVNRMLVGEQMVAIVALLVVYTIVRNIFQAIQYVVAATPPQPVSDKRSGRLWDRLQAMARRR